MDRRRFLRATAGSAIGLAAGMGCGRGQDEPAEAPVHYLHTYTHRLDMERGFKLHCLVPRLAEGAYGEHEYAGFLTARIGEQPWMFIGDDWPEHVKAPLTLQDLKQGEFTVRRRTATWQIEQTARWIAMYPAVWTSAEVRADEGGPVIGALMGWAWAERAIATRWLADGEALERSAGGTLQFPDQCRWVAYHDGHGPFAGLIAFPDPPARVWADDDGLYWDWGRVRAGQSVQTTEIAYALVPGEPAAGDLQRLADGLLPAPAAFRAGVAPGEAPGWLVAANEAKAVPVPPSLAPLHLLRNGVTPVPTAAGDMLLVPGTGYSLDLQAPPELEVPLPRTKADGSVAEEVAQHVGDILAHRLPDGRFEFSQGRTFYDGITCGALAQALAVLSDPLRRQTAEAVRDCLEALFDQHVRSDRHNLLVPPEMPSFIESAIDYPEITATLLYATLAYSLNAEPDYAGRHRELIEVHRQQIWEMTSPCGTAWARADTQHAHIIAESAIGGYIAWASLYHLGKLLSADWAAECRSRAALAWTTYRSLFQWRPEYGDVGVVNGWSNWRAEIQSDPPWAFVQSTWFSFVPFLPVEKEDRYGIWRSLREQPWWEYTGELGSRQRGYDFCNALALARAGLADEVREHWETIGARPFWWDYFDATPALAIAALPQLSALGVEP